MITFSIPTSLVVLLALVKHRDDGRSMSHAGYLGVQSSAEYHQVFSKLNEFLFVHLKH